MTTYILILVGSLMMKPVTTHEFSSLPTCTAVANYYTNFNSIYGYLQGGTNAIYATCIAKGIKSPSTPAYTFTVFGAPGSYATPNGDAMTVLQDFNNVTQCGAAISFMETLKQTPGNFWVNCFEK
jgi:hypothetical protein